MSRAQGRKFGLTVGIAFLVLAAIVWWRDHRIALMVTATLGSALVLSGLLIPTALGPVERSWMALAHAINKVTTPVFMSIVYFGVLAPTGLFMRALGRNPLRTATTGSGFWVSRAQDEDRRGGMDHQF